MKQSWVKRLNFCTRDKNDVRHLLWWNPRMAGDPGFDILPEPGDGLRKYDREKTESGYVLYSPDHSNKFLLINLEGDVIHEWQAYTSHFGCLLPNGHLLLDTEFSPDRAWGIVEQDWNGHEIAFLPCQVHHDFHRLDDGNTMVLCEREVVRPDVGPGTLLSTYLQLITPDREVIWQWNSEDHTIELRRLAGITFPRDRADWTHTNTVQVLPETSASRDPRFRAGNILISHRELDLAAVIDRQTGRIVWTWGGGTMDRQHATIMLSNGHMLAFDNGTSRGYSRILEVEPITGQVVWSYKGTEESPFFAQALSNAQRLPGGNTFICSGSKPDHGRLFEVTPQGEIVWEFQNPYADYAEGEKIVYRAYKYPPHMIEPFLNV